MNLKYAWTLREENRNDGFGYLSDGSPEWENLPLTTEKILEFKEIREKSLATIEELLGVTMHRPLTHQEFVKFMHAKHDTDNPDDIRVRDTRIDYASESFRDRKELQTEATEIRRDLVAYKRELMARAIIDN